MMTQHTVMEFAEPSENELAELLTVRDKVLFIYNRHNESVEENKLLFFYYRKYFTRTTDSEETILSTGQAIRKRNKNLLSPHIAIAREQQRRQCATHWKLQGIN